ncbi:zinc finger family protein [Stylonychia lemnae]|uniref:E3 ubiquitin-protein ligase n=1 Tax=Stylonychia lemnae TaxID=5949 RepID=A0A078BC84_STYLE|nr:zinc finger family protein [Stylonychia lemnae]|eukprot:CDW91208.1 zinc finger family protein [Stylonychia lemnae]
MEKSQVLKNDSKDPEIIDKQLEKSFQRCYSKFLDAINSTVIQFSKSRKNVESYFEDHYFELCKQIMFDQENYKPIIKYIENLEDNKGTVCSKVIEFGDTVWLCKDCCLHPTCIICQECFENSKHIGHQITMSRDTQGNCDCGDIQSWKKEGFCRDHQGYNEAIIEKLIKKIPENMRISTQKAFNNIARQLKQQLLFFTNKDPKKNKIIYIVVQIFEFIEWSINLSPAYISFWKNALDSEQNRELNNLEKPQHHTCTFEQYKKSEIMVDPQEPQKCSCSVYDIIFTRDFSGYEQKQEVISNLLILLAQNYDIKYQLALSYFKNYEKLYLDEGRFSTNKLAEINTQIITVDIISIKTIKEEPIRQHIIQLLTNSIQRLIEFEVDEDEDSVEQNFIFMLLDDLHMMALPRTVNYLANQTEFIEAFIQIYQKLYNQAEVTKVDEHVENEDDEINNQLRDLDLEIMVLMKTYLSGVDYSNENRNISLLHKFIETLQQINSNQNYDPEVGSYILPVHRMFGFYFTRYLITQILRTQTNDKFDEKSKANSFISMRNILSDIIIKINNPSNENKSLDNILYELVRPLNFSVRFLFEIKSRMWIMNGEVIEDLFDTIYAQKTNHLYQYLALYQSIIFCVDDKGAFMDKIIQDLNIFSLVNKIRQLNDGIINNEFEEQKVRVYLNLVLNFIIKIYQTEISLLYPLIFQYKKLVRSKVDESDSDESSEIGSDIESIPDEEFENYFQIDENYQQIDENYQQIDEVEQKSAIFNEEIQQSYIQVAAQRQKISEIDQIRTYFRKDLQKELIHNLILNLGKSNMSQIKKKSDRLYTNSREFEKVLSDISIKVQNSQNQRGIQFNLKEEYFKEFDPYYYQMHEYQHQALENITKLKNERDLMHEYIGSMDYDFSLPINESVRQAICESKLLEIFINFILLWGNINQSQNKFMNEQIGQDSLKLLAITTKSIQNIEQTKVDSILNILIVYKDKLEESFKNLENKSQYLKKDLYIIMKQIEQLDQSIKFALLSENKPQNQLKEEEKNQSNKQSIDKKEAARLKREKIMMKFQNKRTTFIKEADAIQIDIQVEEVKGYDQEPNFIDKKCPEPYQLEEDDKIHCTLCREQLNSKDFFKEPFGQFAYIAKSKLLYYAMNQTIKAQKNKYGQFDRNNEDDEWEEEDEQHFAKQSFNHLRVLQLNYLDSESYTGGTLIKCPHFAHLTCLENYQKSQKFDQIMAEENEIVGINPLTTFQCPLCKSLANILFPIENLSNFQGGINELMENKKILKYYKNLIEQIMRNQVSANKNLQIQDIFDPNKSLKAIQQFIEHRLALINLKGYQDFINGKLSGIQEYRTILRVAKNIIRIQQQGAEQIAENNAFIAALDKNLEEIYKKLDSFKVFDEDITSYCQQALFYTFLQTNQEEFKNSIENLIIRFLHLIKYQVAIKFIHQNQFESVKNAEEIIQWLQEVLQTTENQQNYLDFEAQSLAPYQNQITAFLQMVDINQSISHLNKGIPLISESHRKNDQFAEANYNLFFEYINSKQQSKISLIPQIQLLMTKEYQFNFIYLPEEFQQMILKFYKQMCRWCKTTPKQSVICLLCGELLCFVQDCCMDIDNKKDDEGELTFHARQCEGGQGIFLDNQTGVIFLIEKKRNSEKSSIYLNKFGEHYSTKMKKYDQFKLNDEFGGRQLLEEYRRMYIDFTICNAIVKDRAINKNYYGVGRI